VKTLEGRPVEGRPVSLHFRTVDELTQAIGRLTAGDGQEVHGWLARPFEPVEFDIPAAATAGAKLTLTWTPEPVVDSNPVPRTVPI
jgi:hypothetical protein